MVLKPPALEYSVLFQFENDVKMYGTQTSSSCSKFKQPFENDVKMYGTQTSVIALYLKYLFENDVKMYGTQTVTVGVAVSGTV